MPVLGGFTPVEWLVLVEHELLLFAGVFFLLGALDEALVDGAFGWLRLTGRVRTSIVPRDELSALPIKGMAAVFIPAWQEAEVVGTTIAHALRAWPQTGLRLYVGCYRNDADTLAAAIGSARNDNRLRLVVLDVDGPSTKADCLNRLYDALREDERRAGQSARMILLHDAEDMVDPAALGLLDQAMDHADFVQLPVVPLAARDSRWVSAHYMEEFAEAHGKTMVVRDAVGACLPAAGVGCAFSRAVIGKLAQERGAAGKPFSIESLTEDYELGMRVKLLGGKSRFLRVRGDDGQLIATRACFPATFHASVRQKSRWVHGIAFQSWDRLGWNWSLVELWMRLHDRRGPLTALVMAMGYLLLLLGALHLALSHAGLAPRWQLDPLVVTVLYLNFCAFLWRAACRIAFTAREHGLEEGIRALLRVPLANLIAITAGRRAVAAYVRSLRGAGTDWEKTVHNQADHPALFSKTQALS